MVARLLRTGPLPALVSVVLALALVAGLVADRLAVARRSPLEQARELAKSGDVAGAESRYIALAEQSPPDVPLLVELIDNHEVLLRSLTLATPDEPSGPLASAPRPVGEGRIDRLFSGNLPPDVLLVAGYWRNVTGGE